MLAHERGGNEKSASGNGNSIFKPEGGAERGTFLETDVQWDWVLQLEEEYEEMKL